jgi:hypothetical protein
MCKQVEACKKTASKVTLTLEGSCIENSGISDLAIDRG